MKPTRLILICLSLAVIGHWGSACVQAAFLVPRLGEVIGRTSMDGNVEGMSPISADMADEPNDERDSQSDDKNTLDQLLGVMPDSQGGASGDGVRGAGATSSCVAVLIDNEVKQSNHSSEIRMQVTERLRESPRGARLFRPPRTLA